MTVKRIQICLEPELLKEAKRVIKKHDMKMSGLFVKALKYLLRDMGELPKE